MLDKLPIAAIIVTHNSERFIHKNLHSLQNQTHPLSQIIIVDSGSNDPSYLSPYSSFTQIIYAKAGTGFSQANNIGWQHVQPDTPFVLFLNPDAFLEPDFIEKSVALLDEFPLCGALTGILKGYNFTQDKPTGLYDSTGVFTTWYGRWYDRDQGLSACLTYTRPEEVPALCGALMFTRRVALESILLPQNKVWDESFFMYKEDIDLSLRLKRKNWKLFLFPALTAYHGRGWASRSQMPRRLRLHSARNELKINRTRPLALPYSLAKYLAVKFLNL